MEGSLKQLEGVGKLIKEIEDSISSLKDPKDKSFFFWVLKKYIIDFESKKELIKLYEYIELRKEFACLCDVSW